MRATTLRSSGVFLVLVALLQLVAILAVWNAASNESYGAGPAAGAVAGFYHAVLLVALGVGAVVACILGLVLLSRARRKKLGDDPGLRCV